MVDLAVIIVTWNIRELVLDALGSLITDLENSQLNAEVWVVDSASSDGTPDAVAAQFPQVRLIASPDNLGFAGGNNAALHQMGFGDPSAVDLPKTVYLLNPDTLTQLGATCTLYDALWANPRVGLVGAQLAYGDGSFQHGSFAFPGLRQLWVEFFPTPGRFIEGPFNGRYPRHVYEVGQPFSVGFTLGATMMLKREVIQQTGMFDEQFFMYCEEIDWAWRIHKAGWEVQCVPSARITHLSGQSTRQVRPRSVVDLWTSRLRLYRKHYPTWKLLLARGMVAVGMQRKIRQTRQMMQLATDEQQALIDAYRTVYEMALNL